MPENGTADGDEADADADADEGRQTGSSIGQFDDDTGGMLGQRFNGDEDNAEAEAEAEADAGPGGGRGIDVQAVDDADGSPAGDEKGHATADATRTVEDTRDEARAQQAAESAPGTAATGASVDELLRSGKDSEALLADALAMDAMTVEAVRDRPQVPAYLPTPLAAAHERRFNEFNARRTMRAEPQVRKHAGFQEALFRYALDTATDEDIEAYLPPYVLTDG